MHNPALIITVGTGRNRIDIAGAILKSIKHYQPQLIYFIVSEVSLQETMPIIFPEIAGIPHQLHTLKNYDYDDLQVVYHECLGVIEALKSKNYQVIVDFTSGTKAMSAGLAVAAVSNEVEHLNYIIGERDSGGRVLPDTEKILEVNLNLPVADRYIDMAKAYFDQKQFLASEQACINAQERAWNKQSDQYQKAELISLVSKAYFAWDQFHLIKAIELLMGVIGRCDVLPILLPSTFQEQIRKNAVFLKREVCYNYSHQKVADLLENARRRQYEGKYEDAVARGYRLIEYLAQMTLWQKYGIDTNDVDVLKLPSKVSSKYRWKNGVEQGKKIRLPLYQAYDLLFELDDQFGALFIEAADSSTLLAMRNHSILAHGFEPVSENNCEGFLQYAYKLAEIILPEIESLCQEARFPEFIALR